MVRVGKRSYFLTFIKNFRMSPGKSARILRARSSATLQTAKSRFQVIGSSACATLPRTDGTTHIKALAVFISALFVLSALIVIAPSVSATQTFYCKEDFEVSLTNWTTVLGSPAISTDYAHTGSYSEKYVGQVLNRINQHTIASLPADGANISLWFYPVTIPDGIATTEMYMMENSAGSPEGIYIDNHHADIGYYNTTANDDIDTGFAWNLNAWNHLELVVYDTWQKCDIRLNGGSWLKGCLNHASSEAPPKAEVYFPSGSTIYYDDLEITTGSGYVPMTWAPTFTNSPGTTDHVHQDYTYTATLNESATVTMDAKPSWATLSGKTISGTPISTGSADFKMKAVSTNGTLPVWKNWTVSILDIWAPTFTTNPATTDIRNHTYSYSPHLNESVSLSLITYPNWATWSSGGFSGIPTVLGSYPFKLEAWSTNGTLAKWQNWSVVVGSWVPTFTSTPALFIDRFSLYEYTPTLNETSTIYNMSAPSWASYNAGLMSGTPTVNGAYDFKLRAESMNGTGWKWQNWTVDVGGWSSTFITSPLLVVVRTHNYSYMPVLNESGSISLEASPNWLTFINGYLNGSCSVLGSYNVSLEAVSLNGTLESYQNFSLVVTGWAPVFTSQPNTNILNNSVYVYDIKVNETSTLTLLSPGSWIAGLNNTAIVIAPIRAGWYNVSLKEVSLSGTLAAYQNWSFNISSWAPVFISFPSNSSVTGALYSYSPSLNETGTIYYEAGPSWLTWSLGTLQGTPSSPCSVNISMRGQSLNGGLDIWQNWTLNITGSAPTITSTAPTGGTVSTFYLYDPTANQSNLNWTISGTAWFLSINNATGEVTGIPDTMGIYSVHIQATNQYNLSAWENFSLLIINQQGGNNGNGNGNGNGGGTTTNLFLNLSLDTWVLMIIGVLILIALLVAASRRR